ncbi:hypothetical protein [Arthrobacter sp. TMS1-12-1]
MPQFAVLIYAEAAVAIAPRRPAVRSGTVGDGVRPVHSGGITT